MQVPDAIPVSEVTTEILTHVRMDRAAASEVNGDDLVYEAPTITQGAFEATSASRASQVRN